MAATASRSSDCALRGNATNRQLTHKRCRFIAKPSDCQHSVAIAESVGGDIELFEHARQQVGHWCAKACTDMATTLQLAGCATGQQQRQRIVVMLVRVAHAAAV